MAIYDHVLGMPIYDCVKSNKVPETSTYKHFRKDSDIFALSLNND